VYLFSTLFSHILNLCSSFLMRDEALYQYVKQTNFIQIFGVPFI